MNSGILVLSIFILSCALSVFLVIKKPLLRFHFLKRYWKVESYFLGALTGVVLLLLTQLLPWNEVWNGLKGSAGLNPLGVLILFLSMVFISVFLDQTGFFEYCADLSLKYAKGSAKKLFFSIYTTVALLTIFTSNDIIILTFTPFVYYIAKNAKVNPVPYLFAEFFAANTWSMMLYIGNPTNIIVASALHLDFSLYTYYMLIPTIIAGVINVALLYFIFRKQINSKVNFAPSKIDFSKIIKDKVGTVLGLILLIVCIMLLAVSQKIGLEMWHVAFVSGLILAAIIILRRTAYKVHNKLSNHESQYYKNNIPISLRNTLNKMPWSIIPFVLSLFLLVHALNIHGITSAVGDFFSSLCAGSAFWTSIVYGFSSAFSANILNNIPMTVSFVPIISHAGANTLVAALATTVGSNLGANITPFGALAGIMWFSILKEKKIKIKMLDFVKYGSIITLFALGASLIVLGLEFLLF